MFSTVTTTTDGIGFTHTFVVDDMSLIKFFGGTLATALIIMVVRGLVK